MSARPQDRFHIRRGVPPHLHAAAARLYWRGFGAGMIPLPTPARAGIALVSHGMNPERALIALSPTGALVGIAGLRGHQGGFLSASRPEFCRVFGPIGGSLRHLATLLHLRGAATPDMILDGVAVRPAWRGMGVARALVNAAATHARHVGHSALMVEVEARNRDALAAWSALEFAPAGRQRLGWPWHAPAHVLRRQV